MKKQFIVIVEGKEYPFASKRKADAFFIDSFLSGLSVNYKSTSYEKK